MTDSEQESWFMLNLMNYFLILLVF